MKKTLVAAIMIALLAATTRAAEVATNALDRAKGAFDRRFGAGVILGEPIGASLKYWLNERIALDAAVAWSFGNEDEDEVHPVGVAAALAPSNRIKRRHGNRGTRRLHWRGAEGITQQ